MFRLLSKYGPRMADQLISLKHSVMMMLYVAYIWDLSRERYINTCRRDYEEHQAQSQQAGRNDNIERTNASHHNDQPAHENFGCPYPPMPRILVLYRIFSTFLVIYASVKYAVLCIIYYKWLDIDDTYACYLPGRLAFTTDRGVIYELPWIGAGTYLSHLIYRVMWHFSGPVEVDALAFLCYDKDTVLQKQYNVIALNDRTLTAPGVAYRTYLYNKVFYDRRIDNRGRIVYFMREHRKVDQYERLERAMAYIRLLYLYVIILGTLFIPIISIVTCFSHEHFDTSYRSCSRLANGARNQTYAWSFSDRFRLSYLFFDLIECVSFIADTGLGLTIPFGAGIILSYDLSLRFDALRRRVCNLNAKFRYWHHDWDHNMELMSHLSTTCLEHMQQESDVIFNETISTFAQVGQVDEFIWKLSTYVIYCWLVFNSSYQATKKLDLLPKDGIVTYINTATLIGSYSGIMAFYLVIARPYHEARRLYNELCTAMALCPNIPKAKIAWRWLLEYYRDNGKHTLHLIGKSYKLNNLNILRCASWSITCTVVIFSLLRQ